MQYYQAGFAFNKVDGGLDVARAVLKNMHRVHVGLKRVFIGGGRKNAYNEAPYGTQTQLLRVLIKHSVLQFKSDKMLVSFFAHFTGYPFHIITVHKCNISMSSILLLSRTIP